MVANRGGQNRETEWRTLWGLCWRVFQLPRVKFDEGGSGDMVGDSERGWEALGMGNRSINIWDG